MFSLSINRGFEHGSVQKNHKTGIKSLALVALSATAIILWFPSAALACGSCSDNGGGHNGGSHG
ncbi:MAG: hypothetical protein C0605_10545, partial [Hyphomicrobiales bacterium]